MANKGYSVIEEGSDSWLKLQTKEIKNDDYDDFKDDSKRVWNILPESVIGTLIYFLMVEQNSPHLDLYLTLKAVILIGFPTYMIYGIQFCMLLGLWNSVYGDGAAAITSSVCGIDAYLLVSAITVYWISMIPSFKDMISSSDIILNAKRMAYTQDADDNKVYITNILATPTKRFLVFLLVNLIELGVIVALSYVGVGYLLSSDDVEDLLMNSVSVVFILQIDDMARDAFQSQEISDHIDGMEFETTTKLIPENDKDMSLNGKIRVPSFAAYKTFWALDKAFGTLILSCLCVFPVVYAMKCNESDAVL